ncbi:MAG: helix-turn-helix domain-containing protein [Clostridiales bacterium]|nr:helix-turn-helix domain-containing protein [Clostridiales bacterium]
MRDYKFGTYLYNLRKELALSQGELGAMVGVTNKAVSKWETGESKPALEQLYKLSKIFEVSMENLLDSVNLDKKEVRKIVITGGPCAGKSTAFSWIQEEYTKKGYMVVFVPECATEVILAGFSRKNMSSNLDFQLAITTNQLMKEKLFEETALKNSVSDKILIVCDRGVLDGKAYCTDIEYKQILRILGQNEIELRDGYDAVFHLVTAAKGLKEEYTLETNKARYETADEAVLADDRTLSAWAGHPHLRVIDNSPKFEDKMKNLLKEISAFLGAPTPHEIERKFLIEMPEISQINRYTSKSVEIIQTYLKPIGNEEVRIRQRGEGNNFVYTKTVKKLVSAGDKLETEKRITKDEYLSLMMNADYTRGQIRKTRYCIVYNNQYIEIDIYPFWKDKAILEIELNDINQEYMLPDFVKVIKEVTDDDKYSNYSLAKLMKNDI